MTQTAPNPQSQQDRVIHLITPLVAPLGFEVVHIEIQTARAKVLRVFIDFLEERTNPEAKGIGIEDCVKATKALDEPLDLIPEIEAIFKGPYELEVSSPGVDRPLRTEKDYRRFAGQEVRVHVFRPLSAEELENKEYQLKNPKQKNFLGELKGTVAGKVLLAIPKGGAAKETKGKKPKANAAAAPSEEIRIPVSLISKANIEPKFDQIFEED